MEIGCKKKSQSQLQSKWQLQQAEINKQQNEIFENSLPKAKG